MFIIRLLVALSLLASAGTQSLPDGYLQIGESVQASVLSQEQAKSLFDLFVSAKDIPFDYAIDGCYARATAMAAIAEYNKIEMAKIWVEGNLRVRPKDKTQPDVEWGYHVAPVAFVKENGKAVPMVFDPSLFDKPVTVDKWKQSMESVETIDKLRPYSKVGVRGYKGDIRASYYSGRYQFMPRGIEGKKYSWHQTDLIRSKSILDEYSSISRNTKTVQEARSNLNKRGAK